MEFVSERVRMLIPVRSKIYKFFSPDAENTRKPDGTT